MYCTITELFNVSYCQKYGHSDKITTTTTIIIIVIIKFKRLSQKTEGKSIKTKVQV